MSALTEFNSGLSRCRLIRAIEDQFPDPPTTTFERESVEALRASVAVLMVASFEEFTRQTFREKLALLSSATSGFTLSAYHEALHVESIYAGLLLAYKGTRGGRGRSIQRRADIVAICKTIAADEILVEALSNVDSNPSGSRIVTMLESIGVKAVKKALDKRFRSLVAPCVDDFVVDRLNSIVSLRHQVAHTGRALTISRIDLDTNLNFLSQGARVLDDLLSDFVIAAKRAAAASSPPKKLDI